MRICFIDDSVPFDGQTPLTQPLGGVEKALVGLSTALAGRGHEVTVYNRCPVAATVAGVSWKPLDGDVPEMTDVVIALRKPRLLKHIPMAYRRILWVTAQPAYLEKPAVDDLLDRFGVRLLFLGRTQAASYRGKRPGLTVRPGVADAYLNVARRPASPPVAITTTHPDNNLGWLVDLWTDVIHEQAPEAKLHVYSALLARAARGEAVEERIQLLYDTIQIAEDKGVRILDPLGDDGMATVYGSARCHLYPGHREDMVCWTLGETQAAGVPAVARTRGAVHERVANGETGYIVPDDAAFANVAIQLLTDDGMHRGLSEAACNELRRRPWSLAAQEVESLWAADDHAAEEEPDDTVEEAGG